jgi:16S rRNA (cytidine1402-2'-O)-methyltransferase
VLDGIRQEVLTAQEQEKWETLSVSEHMKHYTMQGLAKKEAMKKVALDRGVSKRDIYQILLKEE